MNRPEVIERIRQYNPSATSEFLTGFADRDLSLYLDRLTRLANHRGRGTQWVRPDYAPLNTQKPDQPNLFTDQPDPSPTRNREAA